MAKIPIILEAGRADGKLATARAIFDENKNMFQNNINQEVEERLNDVKDTLNSNSTTAPLSANQGKVLKELLDAKVIEAGAIPIDTEPIEGNITHIVNSDGLAKEFNKCNTAIINTNRIENSAVTSEKIATSAFDNTLSVSGKIAPADVVGEKLTELEGKTSEISKEIIETEKESIVIEDNAGNVLANITPDSSNFKNLKNHGKDVLTEHQSLNDYAKKTDISGKQDKIEAVEQEQVLTDIDKVELQTESGITAVTIEVEENTDIKEEQVWCNSEDETDEYTKIGSYGIKAKKFLNMDGTNAIPDIDTFISEPSNEKVPSTKAVKDYVDNMYVPITFLPKIIYGVIGRTQQIFINGINRSWNPYNYYNKFISSKGKVYRRYYEITPDIAENINIRHQLINDDYKLITDITTTLKVCNIPTSPTSEINVLCVGASTTANGEWANELKRLLTSNTSVDCKGKPAPQGLSLNNINFCGRKDVNNVNIEATGGWTWGTFITKGKKALRFTVSNVNSIAIDSEYKFTDVDGIQGTIIVAEVNVTGSEGNVRFIYKYNSQTTKDPIASGTLTKTKGGGDGSITYSSVAIENYSPFWDSTNNKVSFVDYANRYCNNHIDVCIIALSPFNDGIMGNENLNSVINDMKKFIDALHIDFPLCKILLNSGNGYSTEYGLEYNYSASSKFSSIGTRIMLSRYSKVVNEFINSDTYSSFCYMVNTITEVDSENVFPTSNKKKNTRTDETEVIGVNGIHPTHEGYMMIADSVFRCFCNVVLN